MRARKMKPSGSNEGFSLVELIVVIAIMAVLVAIVSVNVLKYVEKSRAAVCLTNLTEAADGYTVAQVDAETELAAYTPQSLMDQVMTGMGATVQTPGRTYTGLCPSGGVTSMTVDANGFPILTCSKHGENSSMGFAGALIVKLSGITRKTTDGAVQYLASWLKAVPNRTVDSETTAVKGANTPFSQAVAAALGAAVPENQSWRLSYDQKTGDYVLYVTTGGKVTTADNGRTVSAVRYEFTEGGTLQSQGTVNIKVENYAVDHTNVYPRLKP